MKTMISLAALFFAFGAAALAEPSAPNFPWTPEINFFPQTYVPAVKTDLKAFYDEFRQDQLITVFMGFGYEGYHPGAEATFYNSLKRALADAKIATKNWSMSPQKVIEFKTVSDDLTYRITLSHERNEFQAAFATNEIVMYHGHSRYGRGPAFGSFTNYFRMGDVFKDIEIETQNPYFRNEPITLQDQFPLQNITQRGEDFPYQYRGQKVVSSYLKKDTFTKNIEGGPKDLFATKFKGGRQILYLYSCSNNQYFRNPLREMFPDTEEKAIFGTSTEGYFDMGPDIVFLVSVVKQTRDNLSVVKTLNATKACGNCFTTY